MADPLLEPFKLGPLTLRNRIMSTSHEPAYAEDGKPKLRYQLYHEEKAKGGIALTMIGGSANVSLDSPSTFGQLYVGHDSVIPYLQQTSDRVHRHGAAIMSQITHMGRRTIWNDADWLPTISSSPLREPAHRSFPKTMEDFDIARVVADFASAARRCQEGRLDGVELSAHSGHLIDQFWSPRMNQRDDEYGGSFENRMRFALEVLTAVRAAVGPDFLVGVRMTAAEMADNGLTADDCIDIGQALQISGQVDFISLVTGSATSEVELSRQILPMGTPLAPYLPIITAYKSKVDLPLFHASRIADLPTARHALREGHIDMVGMVRAHIADPHIVAKLERGEEERIRPCIGVSYCLNRIYVGLDALCLHNPATGREETIPHVSPPAAHRKKVVVVGGGPAGLEAARVAAERGHQVTLLEASDKVGGQIRLASRASFRRHDLLSIVHWLEAEIRTLGGTIRANVFAEADDVLALEPDVVVVATGGLPKVPALTGGEELVTSSWDILSGDAKPRGSVLVYDEHGGEQAISIVERLATSGAAVEMVTPDRMVAHDVTGSVYPGYLAALYEQGVTLTPDHRLVSVTREGGVLTATLRNEYTDALVERQVEQVVVEHGTDPFDDLYFELRDRSANRGQTDFDVILAPEPSSGPPVEGGFVLHRIGDAVAHRDIHAAMLDARRLLLHT
jgi:N-methyl-L-proline demethylase